MWKRNIDQLPLVCALTWDWAHNLGICLDQELNSWPSGLQDNVPTNWATLARAPNLFFCTWLFNCSNTIWWKTGFSPLNGLGNLDKNQMTTDMGLQLTPEQSRSCWRLPHSWPSNCADSQLQSWPLNNMSLNCNYQLNYSQLNCVGQLKKSTYKWTHAVQNCLVQGELYFQFYLIVLYVYSYSSTKVFWYPLVGSKIWSWNVWGFLFGSFSL